jgi:glycosyltransferase involved in cell wall biosynthesis
VLAADEYQHLQKLSILQLRRNMGHQRAIAVGMSYIEEHLPCKAVLVMDSDGEDQPSDLVRLLEVALENKLQKIVFGERRKRTESVVFKFSYKIYKLIYKLLVGKEFQVGNFTVVPKQRVSSLVSVSELWNHYAASILKSRQPCLFVPVDRGVRLDGKSKMNFVSLVIHGLSSISVDADIVGIRMLLFSLGMMVITGTGILFVVMLKYFTNYALLGWATSAIGLLLIILVQFLTLSVFFSFITLSNRQATSVIPLRDYRYFVLNLVHMWGASKQSHVEEDRV